MIEQASTLSKSAHTPPIQKPTMAATFVARVQESPNKTAFYWRCTGENSWQSWTWREFAKEVCRYTAAMRHREVSRGDRVVLLSENRIEWLVADLAMQLLGAINVPLHSESTSSQVCDLIEHAQPKLILVSNQKQLTKTDRLGSRFAVCSFELPDDSQSGNARSWMNQIADAPNLDFKSLVELAESIESEDLISILYTSGTTGEPKGVMLTHANVCANVESKLATLPLGHEDVRLCVLPLSHIFARVCDFYTGLSAGCETYLSRGWNEIFDELRVVRPTYINAVPYFYEKCFRLLQQQDKLSDSNALKEMLGGRTKVCNCGGAPLAEHVYEYFNRCRVGLVTGYGLTETSPVVTSCRVGHSKVNSVGPVIPGVEIKLADDGEVLVRGKNVMRGYYLDERATKNVFREDWFRTGDIGRLDEDGFLFIIGRKKELIVTTGAKKIAPIPLENALNAHSDIDQSLVFGDRQDYLVVLIVLNESLRESVIKMDFSDGSFRDRIRIVIDEQLQGFSKYEQIGKFAFVPEPFSVENGLLTAKKSLRRERIVDRYRNIIEGMYAE